MAIWSRPVRLCIAAAFALSLSAFAVGDPAAADPVPVPSLVDDGTYPGAAQILDEQNVQLVAGDGHVVLADCSTPPVGDLGLMKVYTTDEAIGADGIGRVCFKVTASGGWLSLQVPGVYEIRGDGQRTGTGHEVTAELVNDEAEHITVDVDPDGSTQVGLGADPNASPTMLLQLRAGDGVAPVTGSAAAVGKATVGERMCTVSLVAPQWVLGVAACFAANPLSPSIAEGPLSGVAGVAFPAHSPVALDYVIPYPGRDLVLARMASAVTDVTPLAVAASAAPVNTALSTVGFGRTATEWVSEAQQGTQITFTGTTATTLSAASGPLVCKGMAGAPIMVGGAVGAVLSQAGQNGCFDTAGTTGTSVTAARTDGLKTWIGVVTTTAADHTWSLAEMPGSAGSAVTTAADSMPTETARPLTSTGEPTWATGDTFSPAVEFNGVAGSLGSLSGPVKTDGSFTLAAWVKPTASTGTVIAQEGVNHTAFRLSAGANNTWSFATSADDSQFATLWKSATTAPNTLRLGQWTHLTATYDNTTGIMRLYVDGVEAAAASRYGSAFASSGLFRIGGAGTGQTFAGRISTVQTWNRLVDPDRAATPAGYYKKLSNPTRFLDTRSGTGGTTGPVARNSVVRLQVAGVNGIPASGVTAVAVNLATVLPQDNGYLIAWADARPQPYAETMLYAANVVTSGYAIVPVATNGYIDIMPGNRSMISHIPPLDTSTHIIADVSGYFTTDSTGASSYTPFGPKRYADSRTGSGGHSGKIPANTTWDYKVTGFAAGSGTVPDGITSVVANVTVVSATAGGYVTAWEQGQAKPTASGLQFQAANAYAQMAVIPVNPSTGKFSISASQSTHVIIDVLGYFAPGTAGLKYHAFPSLTLLNTALSSTFLPAGSNTTLAPPAAMGSNAVMVAGLQASSDAGGNLTVYPNAASAPDTSTLNYRDYGQSNLAVVPGGTDGAVKISVTGSAQVWIGMSCTGLFAAT